MDRNSLIRTVLLVLALLNQVLTVYGLSPLPIDDAQVETAISLGFTIVIAVWSWWKNNYISQKGLQQKEALKQNGLYKP